jgi:hypothetical protein
MPNCSAAIDSLLGDPPGGRQPVDEAQVDGVQGFTP